MAADHAEGCMLASNNHTVTIINKLKLTDDDFRRLNQGQWLNCKVCVCVQQCHVKRSIYVLTHVLMQLLEAYFWLVAKECSQVHIRTALCARNCCHYITQQGVDVKVLNSHFWSQFVANGYQATKHWIAKVWAIHSFT